MLYDVKHDGVGGLIVHAFPDALADTIIDPEATRITAEDYPAYVESVKDALAVQKDVHDAAEAAKLPSLETLRAQLADISAKIDAIEAKP